MIRPVKAVCTCAFLMAACLTTQANAQSSPAATKSPRLLGYDASKEVTLKGTVTSVRNKSEAGRAMANHVLVATASGTVEANLGRFAFAGREPLSIGPGQEVELTGVMTGQPGHEIFITRTVKTGNQVYTLRNERGFALSAQSRERTTQMQSQKAARKEVQP